MIRASPSILATQSARVRFMAPSSRVPSSIIRASNSILTGTAISAAALGVGAMYGRDVVIASRCLECGGPIHVETHDCGAALKRYTPARTVVWLATRLAADGCAAKSACKSMAFFCSDDHLASWRKDGGAEGFRLSIEEGLQVGRALFQPLLASARPD